MHARWETLRNVSNELWEMVGNVKDSYIDKTKYRKEPETYAVTVGALAIDARRNRAIGEARMLSRVMDTLLRTRDNEWSSFHEVTIREASLVMEQLRTTREDYLQGQMDDLYAIWAEDPVPVDAEESDHTPSMPSPTPHSE